MATWDETREASVIASVAHADAAYMESAAVGSDVAVDLAARVDLADDVHTEIDYNDTYAVGAKVQVEVGPDDDGDGQHEGLSQEVIVKDLAEAGTLFEVGGPLPSGTASAGVDGLYLAERSKQTGEKYF